MDLRELEETAQLARLTLTREELGAALPAFEQMLGFFAAMQGADDDTEAWGPLKTDAFGPGESPEAQNAVERRFSPEAQNAVFGARLVRADHFRGDQPAHEADPAERPVSGEAGKQGTELLDNAGERDGRFIVIPNVL